MPYLEYEVGTGQVVEIYAEQPPVDPGYDYSTSNQFAVGDEFEWTIWVNEVDEKKTLLSYSAIRNNPNAKRLLKENMEFKRENEILQMALAEAIEKQEIDKITNQLALAELMETLTIKGVL